MCGGVLRANVDHKVLGLEDASFLFDDFAVLLHPGVGEVGLALVLDRYGVDIRVVIVVLAQWEAFPVDIEEQAAHIGIVYKDDAEVVVDLALVYCGYLPEVENRVYKGLLAVTCGHHFDSDVLVGAGGDEIVDAAQSGFLPVHTDDGDEIVELQLVAEH